MAFKQWALIGATRTAHVFSLRKASGHGTVGLGGTLQQPAQGGCYAVRGVDLLMSMVSSTASDGSVGPAGIGAATGDPQLSIHDSDGAVIFDGIAQLSPTLMPVGWIACFSWPKDPPTIRVGGN